MNRRTLLRLAAPALLLALAACGGGVESDAGVRQGLADAKQIFVDANHNASWQGQLDVLAGSGAPIAPFIVAHLPMDAKFKNYQDKHCATAWCVAVTSAGNGHFTLEAYGESMARPIATETVKAY